jgi:hypothetical protein
MFFNQFPIVALDIGCFIYEVKEDYYVYLCQQV